MSAIDEVKDRLDIVEFIQSYVPLKKAGRNYKGLCPFHAEKTPSFVVFPDSGRWHCFGACGTGGDVFTFIMKQENLDFGEALKTLAQRAGVELEPPSPQLAEAEKRLNLLREINQAAATYFHHLLINSDEAVRARAYLEKRGIKRETLDRFQIGYALNQWDGLLRYLTSRRYAVEDVAETGLIIERDDGSGHYDRFRGRVIFPIRDHRGQTIGFGGRVLDDSVPKYLNSPQTPLFDKSSVLFGLDQAKVGIRTTGQAIIVEGYMDVLMAHQNGLNNLVAQMGTALTEAQLVRLKRHTQQFVLALDSDVAGDQATLRGLDVARQVMDREIIPVPTARGLIQFEDRLAADIRILSLPPGRDPDEVIRESPSRWAQLVAQAKPVMDYYFSALTADLDLSTAKGKAEAVRLLGPLLAEIGDRVQRTHYLQRLARMVQIDERSLWQQIRETNRRTRPSRSKRQQPEPQASDISMGLEEHCLASILSYPRLLEEATTVLQASEEEPLDAQDFSRPEDRAILAAWRQWLADSGTTDARAEFYDTLEHSLQQRVDLLIRAQEAQPRVPDDLLREKFLDAISKLRLRNLQREIDELRFLLEDSQGQAASMYGPLITRTTLRIRRLQQAMSSRSLSGRRHEDAPVRMSYGEA